MTKNANHSKRRKSVGVYVDPTGRFGTIRKLWERYCGLIVRIEKLQKELDAVQQELLREDPSFFDVKDSMAGLSFPFSPELKGLRKSNPGIAFRNAIILRAAGMRVEAICLRLDSHNFPLPKRLKKDFPELKTWVDAYNHKRCRPRLEKLISDVRAHGRLP